MKGTQEASRLVASLPSMSPLRIAYRPPEVIVILGVGDGNQCVIHRLGGDRKQAGVLGEFASGGRGDRQHHRQVDGRDPRLPEAGDRRLVGGPLRALLHAQGLNFIVIACPHGTGEARRRSRAELVGAGQQPGLAPGPVRDVRQDRGHVDPWVVYGR